MMLTQRRLRALLRYDPATGIFINKVDRAARSPAGSVAGSANAQGRVYIKVGDKLYQAHRLAFLYMTGRWPRGMVDHRDTDPSNNRWGNLRDATRSQNGMNRGAPASSATGIKGVCWHKKMACWRVRVIANKRKVAEFYLSDLELAELVAKEAQDKYHGRFNHGGTYR